MDELIDRARNAQRILLPKGKEAKPTIDWLRTEAGIDVPVMDIKNGELRAIAGGQEFFAVRGASVPYLLAKNAADIGLAGSDSFLNYKPASVEYRDFGAIMCQFVLAAPRAVAKELKAELPNGRSLRVATNLRGILRAYARETGWNLDVVPFIPNGSVEIMPDLGIAEAVADLKQTGKTLKRNGLAVIETIKDIKPAMGWSVSDE